MCFRISKPFLIALLVMGLLQPNAAATDPEGSAAAEVLQIRGNNNFAPYEFVDQQGEPAGYNIDLMKAIAKAGGFEVEFQNTAWDGIFAGLANGDYDAVISSVTITEERKKSKSICCGFRHGFKLGRIFSFSS